MLSPPTMAVRNTTSADNTSAWYHHFHKTSGVTQTHVYMPLPFTTTWHATRSRNVHTQLLSDTRNPRVWYPGVGCRFAPVPYEGGYRVVLILPWPDVASTWCCLSLMLPQPDVTITWCYLNLMLPQPDVASNWCYHNLMLRQPDVTITWYYLNLMLLQPDVTITWCYLNLMLPQLHVTLAWRYRNLVLLLLNVAKWPPPNKSYILSA